METFRWRKIFALSLIFFANGCLCDGPEQGIFVVKLDEENRFGGVSKSLQEETEIGIKVDCTSGGKFMLEWMVRFTECNEMSFEPLPNGSKSLEVIFSDKGTLLPDEDYIAVQNGSYQMNCETPSTLSVHDESENSWTCYTTDAAQRLHCIYFPPPTVAAPPTAKPQGEKDHGSGDKRRRAAGIGARQKRDVKTATTTATATIPPPPLLVDRVTTTSKHAGRYWVLVHLKPLEPERSDMLEVTLTITMLSKSGYLSAFQAPLLIFYGIMCGVYSLIAFIWLLMLAFQWRDLLRIQFWIGGVILLGLLEKAVFYAEYENLNKSGKSMAGAIIFAELISCFKRSLARMLVVIVSLGYGITRPRLGRDLHWVLGAGMAYFILSSIEACLRVKGTDQHAMIALLPLAVLDAIICWWIFKSLVDTTRTLRLRRNLIKLWLYRHFTNTLIFCVVAAVIFLLWSIQTHRRVVCLKKWHELWIDDGYWHILFFVILVVIVILFRPTANNQRYAFSPLTDRDADDESQEPMMNDAFEGVKMRNVVTNRSESHGSHKTDDDLKWVEDNIPASVADAALGAFDDSEEELVTNLERNKME